MPSFLKRLPILGTYSGLLILSLLSIGPFLWLLSTAFKGAEENIFAYPPVWLPQQPTVEHFVTVWQKIPMLMYLWNSLGMTLVTIGLNLAVSILAGFPLARMSFKGQHGVLITVLATMMIPFQVIMIPLYLLVLQVGLGEQLPAFLHAMMSPFQLIMLPLHLLVVQMGLESQLPKFLQTTSLEEILPLSLWFGLAIPFAVSGFGIFMVRQALVSIPKALEESAILDGCNSIQVLWYVLLPLIRPTLATLSIFTFMAVWGEFLWPSLIVSKPDNFTLSVGLVQLQGAFSANWRWIAAGTILAMIPSIVFFLALQKQFMENAMGSGVKG